MEDLALPQITTTPTATATNRPLFEDDPLLINPNAAISSATSFVLFAVNLSYTYSSLCIM